ncbi:interleukin-13 receptor subunit alpha-1-like isoform X2 [Brienomyrus brachyistius]|nr:interleukin-13 receptor subunit alpha-1-like isoform X2 [Brienomyrus brachyistius]
MPVLVIYLFFVCVDWHNYVHADQSTVILSTDRSIFTSESPGNKLSSPSLSAEKVLDEGYDQDITDVLELDNYEEYEEYEKYDEYEDEYHALVTLYKDHNGRGDFAQFHVTEISKNEKISMEKIYSNITLPPGLHRLLVKNVSCIVYNTHHLNCSLAVEGISKGAQYSFTVHRDDSLLSCYSFMNNEARVVKCNGKTDYKDYFTLKINVTVADFQYVHRQQFEAVQIEKLNPPHNVTASFISGNLYIEWNLNSNLRNICFLFELKINQELLEVFKQMNFTILNIDQTQSYKIQIRVTKTDSCRKNDIWSDWSEPVVVNPRIKPDALNVPMICGISLGIPMLLLAVFLPCWRPRLFNKLFPPVPSPSMKIQELLEKDDVIQEMQFRYLEEIVKVEDDSD